MVIDVDLLKYRNALEIRQIDNHKYIKCLIRRKWLRIQPEEIVRQIFLLYLVHDLGYHKGRIAVEKEIKILDRSRRFDILIYDKNLNPHAIVECKAPHIKVNQSTMEQISAYNLGLQVDYLIVTNGIKQYCCKINYMTRDHEFLNYIPSFKS